ncbi:MAG: peptidoglycan-binding protein [bacterium]|nr:peptidoglycan-binding protein [bacterium]
MSFRKLITSIAGAAVVLSFGMVSAASALTASCVGVSATSSITWTGSTAGGVAPIAFLWGNGSTSSVQTVTASVGAHSMTLGATDASSTVATTTCAATVNATSPGNTLAQQIQALLNQINILKAQILQLVTQQVGSVATTTPTAICFDFRRDLHSGDDGDDVRELQRTLSSDPSIFPPGLITGFFGHRTEEALKKFQRKFGIFTVGSTTTGYFGPRSRALLKENCGKADTDHDGITNSIDTDDDNDGTPDVEDSHPQNPNVATSTNTRSDERGKKGDNGRKGMGGRGNPNDD